MNKAELENKEDDVVQGRHSKEYTEKQTIGFSLNIFHHFKLKPSQCSKTKKLINSVLKLEKKQNCNYLRTTTYIDNPKYLLDKLLHQAIKLILQFNTEKKHKTQ